MHKLYVYTTVTYRRFRVKKESIIMKTGKTIRPFCTHEGSGLGSSLADIKKLCPGAKVEEGLAIRGGAVGQCRNLLEAWLTKGM